MKKKVISLFVTGMLAVSMIAGCGSDNTADTSTSADTTADASTDAAADTTAEEAPAATTDFDASEYVNVLSREDGSGTRGAFIELFGIEEKDADGNKVDNTTEEAIITNSTSVMLTSVASDEYAIGYVSLGSLDDTVKAVSIDGAEASVENIKNGTYINDKRQIWHIGAPFVPPKRGERRPQTCGKFALCHGAPYGLQPFLQ